MAAHDPGASWTCGELRSARFDDLYFSRAGGLAEARQVFLAGCGLPERWRGRRHFTVGELGFGTGLSMLALIDLWRRHRPTGATLHLFSVEGFPLARADAASALAAFPEIADLAAPLLARWPGGARGICRIDWPGLGVVLDLAILEAHAALAGWDGQADAWFLDGFAPAKNPAMWSDAVFADIRRCAAPGCRIASYSVAGAVRRGLAAQGFAVRREPGFAAKRQRLEAELGGVPIDAPVPRIAIIGAGIAGASLARAFAALGVAATVVAAGPMASGNPAALVAPRLAAGSARAAALHAQAFRRSVALVRATAPAAILAEGSLHLLGSDEEAARAAATQASGLFDPGAMALLAPADTATLLAEAEAPQALRLDDSLVIDPGRLLAAWCPAALPRTVASIAPQRSGWRLCDGDGMPIMDADILCLAAGFASAALAGVPLRPVRGQVEVAEQPFAGSPASWGGYAIPTAGGLLFGATHDRDDPDPASRACDTQANLAGLARTRPALAAQLAGQPLRALAGVRAGTPDHQPVAGEWAPGLYILSGLGGRGFALAPLLAEHVAARALGLPSPLPLPLAALVDPSRLRRRG